MRPPLEVLAASFVAIALACLTITATPGIESAATLGVVLPPIVAAAGAFRAATARGRGFRDPDASMTTGVLRALVAFLAAMLVAALRLGLEPACAEASGFSWLVLGVLPGMVLAALVGELVGRLVRRPRLAAFVAFAVPVAAYGVVAWEIWSTPAVFVFTIFAGHWPGPIYDESRTLPEALVTYRLVTLLAILALGLGLRFGPRSSRPSRTAGLTLAIVCGLGFVLATVNGAASGHRTSVARIDSVLGGRIVGPRCSLHVPSEMSLRERRRLLAECEAHVVDVERILAVRRRAPLEAFVYRSASEKASLVGAGETYVAKPWRGEVHVQREEFPHEVLRHEIVHVIAAELGPWPFRVSGRLGGMWMNPGLVEGLAVAVADEPRDDLTPDEWSLAMLELDRLPRARSLFGAGFLGQGAGASYAAAGSFVAHLLRTRGPAEVGAMYRRGSVGDDATIEREERAWHASLRTRLGRSSERALTKVRFRLLDRGLLSTRCGRLRARIGDELTAASRRFDGAAALERCSALLAIDPTDAVARTQRALVLARGGDLPAAEAALAGMHEGEVPAALRARIHSVLADAWIRRGGHDDEARRHLEAALAIPQDDDISRTLEVRRIALDRTGEERTALLRAVVEPGRESRSELEVGARLARTAEHATDGLPAYLLGRRFFFDGRDDEAEVYLARAANVGAMPTERLTNELARLRRRVTIARALAGDEDARAAIRAAPPTEDPRLAPFERAIRGD